MNKTTTRISYCLGILLILLNYSAYAQHVDASTQSSPIIVTQSQTTAYFSTRTDIVAVQYAYALNGGSASLILPPFIGRKTDTELDFNLTSLNYSSYRGKVVEIQRQVLLANGTIDDDDKNYYVYPFNPSVSLSVCSGKIKAKDISGNDAGLMRRYELRQNGNLLESPNSASDTLQFLSDVQPGLTYTVKIIIFSTGGRPGSNGHVYEGVQSITVPAAPTLTTNFSTTCAGKEVQLSATGGGSYQWSSGNQTSAQVSVYPSTTTTYSVSVTQSAGCAAIVRYITINVHPSPAVSIDPTSPICVGSTVQLRARGSGGTPGYVYNWSSDNGDQSSFVGSTSGEIVSVQPSVSTGYRVTITDGNGCESTAQAQVVVNPIPTASIDPIPPTVNAGSNVTLIGRGSGGTSPYQYSWSNTATTSSITITASTTTTYRLTVTDNKSCSSVAEVLLTVSTQPDVSIAPLAQPICAGVATVLQSSISGGTSPYTYLWSNGATTSNATVSPSVTSTYGLTVTDQQGKKDSTQVEVLVNPKPVPSIQGTQPNCAGQSTVLTASGGNTYLWNGGATAASITVNPAQSTTYSVTVKNTYNCSVVDSFRVIVPAALQLGYGLQNDQDCTPNNVTVVPNPLNAQAPLSYSMQRNGNTTLNPSLSNLTTDTFTLTVTDNKGCTASTIVTINEVAPLRITLSKEREHDCTPGNTKINVSSTGARGALSYRLDNGAPYTTPGNLINVPNGLHTVSVQDAFGCIASDTVRIAEDSLLVVAEPLVKHVTCPGGSDGSISLPVRGGTGTYYFNWSNLGSSTNVLSNIPEGSYAVTVVDSRNCQVTKTINVNEPGDIGFGAQRIVKHVTCYGGSDGSLEVTTPFSGGTAPYSFLWSNGATTNIASNLSSGQYGVTITDAKGCQTAFWSTGISEPAPININSSGQYTNHLDCIANNVSITVAATGGRGGYTYSLNGGAPQNSGIFTGQSNGTHQLIVKDSASCSQTFNIEVVEHVPFTLGYRLENDQDCTPSNTTIVPLPQNAQGPISYILVRNSNININPSLSGLSTGAYTLSGTDSKGCSASVSVTINEKIPPLPIHLDTLTVCAGVSATLSVHDALVSGVTYVWTVPAGANNPGNVASFGTTVAGVYSVVMTDTSTGCSSSAQGEVRHTPGPDPDLCCSENICAGQSTYLSSNNYTPLSFAWSTGASTRGISVNPVQSTTYTLTVTDAAGCKGTAQVSVQILPKPSVQIDSVPPICSGDTITLRAVVSSGTAPYVYYWGSGSSGSSFKVSPSNTSTYTVSITDVNGCMASAQVVVPVRTRPNVELGANQIVCTGTNATLRADVLNGTAPFTYAWSNGATQSLINVIPSTTTTYIVTVTDAIGCRSSDQVTVQVNPRPILTLGSDATICAGTSTTITANLSGGTAPFTYSWSNGSSASTLTVNPTSTSTYTLTVTDQKGCLAIGSTTVNVLPRPSVSVGPDRAICVGSSTTLSVSASSANPPLTYAWSTGASTSNLSLSPSATTTYTVTVTDGRACSQIDTIVVGVNTTTAGISGNTNACVGQNTTLTATGGGTYLWSTGASTASIVVSPNATTTYTVTVTNQGCLDTATHVLNVSTTNVTLKAPNILNTTDCQTGNIAFEVKYTGSSTPGLEFRMNGGAWQSSPWFTNRSAGSYLIEGRVVTPTCILSLNSRNGNVTEASGATVIASISLANESDCTTGNTALTVNLTQNVSADYRLYPSPNWGTFKTFSNRSSGKYIVEVRPSNSSVCMERDTIEFDEKTASITSVNITGLDDCIQGNLRIEVSATGTPQSGPLQYRLKNYTSSLTGSWQDNAVFTNPPNASTIERVEVKTSSGCIYSSQTFNYGLSDVDPLDLDITGLTYISGATDCIKGNTRVNITTSTGEGVSVSQWRINGGAWTWSPEFYGLGRDTIFVEVLAYDDVRSCVVGKKLFVNERSIPEITQLVLAQHDDCVLNNTQISTQKTGGEGTIRYKLNTGSLSTNPIFSNLGSGNYLVTVRDGNACEDTMSVRITEPALLAITTSKANESDCTGGNARITVSTTGARGTLSYSINGGTPQASNIFNNLSNGTYTVTAQDGVGCTASKSVTINESGALIATPVKTGENDCVLGNTSVAINVTGALSTLSYRLNGGTAQASNVFSSLSNGSHTISVQDAGGCSTSTTFTVNEPSAFTLGTPQIQAVKCYGDASGSIGLNVSGGVTPYTINWSNGAQGAFIQHLPAGTYAFTVTDSRGCTVSAAASVPSPSAFQVQLSNFVDVACHNGTTGAISAVVTGGMSPYTYRWSNSATTSSIANVAAGNYGLTVTDANGCVATATGSLANPAPLSLSHQVANDLDCIPNNLSITALASGGRGNYTFSLNGGTPQAEGLFTGKTTGTYTLTLQDGAGCSAEPRVLGMITEKLPPPVISIDTVRECVGTSASLNINGAPGTGMQYNWTVPNGANNPGNVAQFSTLIAGTYSVVMTDTATGCTRTASGVVVHKPLPIADVCCKDTICAGDSLTLHSNPGYATYLWSNGATTASNTVSPLATTTYTLTVTGSNGCSATDQEIIVVNPQLVANAGTNKVICAGDTTLLSGSASGGTGPYTYHWSTGASTSTISVSPSGTTIYTLTVTDQQGCSDTSLVVITVNPVPQVSDWQSPAQICKGDSSVIGVNGGTQYLWENGATTQSITVSPQVTTRYYVTISNEYLCSTTTNARVIVVDKPSLTISSDTAICAKDSLILSASAAGGTSPYTYNWSTGDNAASVKVSPLSTKTYTVILRDNQNCKDTAQVNIQVNPLPTVQILGQDSLCQGTKDTLRIQTSGGTQPYTYLWNTGSTTASLLVDTTSSVLYTVEVRDSNTCISRDSFALTINPLPVVQVKAADTLRCDNSQVLLAPLTASGSLQFQWKTSAGHTLADSSEVWVDSMDTYILEVVDSVGCSSSDSTWVITYIPQIIQIDSFPSTHCDSANAQIHIQLSNPGAWLYRIDSTEWDTSATFSGLLMGTYAISIASPDTSCIIDTSITIGSREICIEICAGDSILIGKPGLNPWCMKWLPEDGLSNPDSSYTWVKPTNSTIYRLIITDDDGNIVDSLIYNVTLCLSVYPSQLNLCEWDNPTLTAIGGTGPFIWKDENGIVVGSGEVFEPTKPGVYSVEQVEGGVSASAQVIKQINNDSLKIEPALAVLCNDTLTLRSTPGFETYTWINSIGQTLGNSENLLINRTGRYTLYAQIGSCTDTTYLEVLPFAIMLESVSTSCFDSNDGQIQMQQLGGAPPFQYTWNNGATTQNLNNVPFGKYWVVVTDSLQCTRIDTIDVDRPLAFTASIFACDGENQGQVSVTPQGGTAPYAYLWSNGATTAIIAGVTPGVYTVTITDAKGCQLIKSGQVELPEFLLTLSTPTQYLNCNQLPESLLTWDSQSVGGRGDSLNIHAPEGYSVKAFVKRGCQSCGQTIVDFQDNVLSTDTLCEKTVERIWRVRDDCGHFATATQILTWADTTKPHFVEFPQDAILPCGDTLLPEETPIAIDNCDLSPLVTLDSTYYTANECPKILVRIWKVADKCGNYTIKEQKITYQDTTVQDSVDVEALYNCGDQIPAWNTDTTRLDSAKIGDQFLFNHFPVALTNVTRLSPGHFSGQGIVPLPFAGKKVKVVFSDISVDASGKIKSGQLQAVSDFDGDLDLGGEVNIGEGICKDASDQSKGKTDANGFNKRGEYDTKPPYPDYQPGDPFDPKYDPRGFDANGVHVITGDTFDENGCDQKGYNKEGQKCPDYETLPYYWLRTDDETAEGADLVAKYRDSLRTFITNVLTQLEAQNRDSLAAQVIKCTSIRTVLNGTVGSFNVPHREMIFGKDDAMFVEGMWRNFVSTPEPFKTNQERAAGAIALENGIISLYHCDKKQSFFQILIETIIALGKEENLNAAVQNLIGQLRQVNSNDAQDIDSAEGIRNWVKTQMEEKTKSKAESGLSGDQDASIGIVTHRQEFVDRAQRISTSTPSPFSENHLETILEESPESKRLRIKEEFLSGSTYVNGVHRAFYLEKLAALQASPINAEEDKFLLPIKLSQEILGQKYTILIDQITLSTSGASCNAYFVFEIPTSGEKVVFQAENVVFTPGGLTENTTLRLLSDVNIRINNVATLTIKGGHDSTYVSWNCEGFQEMGIGAEIEFCRNIIEPIHPSTLKVIEGEQKVKARFQAVMPSWGEFLAKLDFDPFQISGVDLCKFKVQNAMLDLSETLTPADITFPKDYSSTYLNGNRASWKGFYLQNMAVTVNNIFEGKNPLNNFQIAVKDFIIDDRGVSGQVNVGKSLIPLERGNLGGWAFSLDSFSLNFIANQLKGGGLGGLINVPILSKSVNSTTISPEDCFSYAATIEPGPVFRFAVKPKWDSMAIPMWKAQAILDNTSSLEATFGDSVFHAVANISGELKIDGELLKGMKLTIPGVRFENLQVSNRAPHFSIGKFELPKELGIKFGGFELEIRKYRINAAECEDPVPDSSALQPGTRNNLPQLRNAQEAAEGSCARLELGIWLKLGDGDLSIGAEGDIGMHGQLTYVNERQKWVYGRPILNGLRIEANIKGNKIDGGLNFYEQDENFGKGVRGILNAKFKGIDAQIRALAQFGNMGSYKYFMVDAGIQFEEGVSLAGPLRLKAIGGGVFNHMRRETPDDAAIQPVFGSNPSLVALGQSLSGVVYVPDAGTGLSLKIGAGLIGTPASSFNANLLMEANFSATEGKGISIIQLRGVGQFMNDFKISIPPKFGSGNPTATISGLAAASAFVDMKYNFDERTFDANFDVYLNAGLVVGANAGNQMGQAIMHFGKDKWFVHIGTPEKRVGIKLAIPGANTPLATLGAYLDMGTEIPAMPPLPAYAQQISGLRETALTANQGLRSAAGGFMFGADFSVNTGDLKFLIFYASLQAGLGFDLMLRDYGNATCASSGGGRIGINGWYGSGQAWAYLQGEVGILLKKKNKKFTIAALGAGVAMQMELPNPIFARGAFSGNYKILGGLVKGKFNFNFTIGESCGLQEPGSGEEEGVPNFEVIAELSPSDSAKAVSPITLPVARFNAAVGEQGRGANMELYDDYGDPEVYKIELVEATLTTAAGEEVSGQALHSADLRSLSFKASYVLPANTQLNFKVKVKIINDGQVIREEEKQVSFKTDTMANTIPLANIEASYPLNGMHNLYREENIEGFLKLRFNQFDLLKADNNPRVQFISGSGGVLAESKLNLTPNDRYTFQIPGQLLQASTEYRMRIVVQLESGAADQKLCELPFRTSQYGTFAQKVAAFAQQNTLSFNPYDSGIKLESSIEPFDEVERGNMLSTEASKFGNAWFSTFAATIYSGGDGDPNNGNKLEYNSQFADDPYESLPLKSVTWENGQTLQYNVFKHIEADFYSRRYQVSQLLEQKRLCENTLAGDCANVAQYTLTYLEELASQTYQQPPIAGYGVIIHYSIPGYGSVRTAELNFANAPN